MISACRRARRCHGGRLLFVELVCAKKAGGREKDSEVTEQFEVDEAREGPEKRWDAWAVTDQPDALINLPRPAGFIVFYSTLVRTLPA